MDNFKRSIEWGLVYPLGLIAILTLEGRRSDAVAHARALLEHKGDVNGPVLDDCMLKEVYRSESYMVNEVKSNPAPLEELKPLWVANRALKRRLTSHPLLYKYCLERFIVRQLELMDE